MIFLPGSCERCFAIALISSAECVGGKALCGSCGGLVLIVPGCAYPEGDVPLFDELCALVMSSPLAGPEAGQIALALEEAALTSGDEEALSLVAFWIPAFAGVRPLLSANPLRARQACSMLHTLLQDRARVRSSGTFPKRQAFDEEDTFAELAPARAR